MNAHLYLVPVFFSQPPRPTAFLLLPCLSTMADKSKRPKGRDSVLSSLDVAIDGLNLAEELSSVTPAKTVFGSVSILLTMIKVRFLLCCDEISRIHT